MLVISNGAMKSGSTWLTAILQNLVDHQRLPEGFQDPRFGDIPTIRRDLLRKFLEEVDYRSVNYISKNHFYYERPLLSRCKDVYVFDITRDMADTLVSFFFHAKKKLNEWNASDPDLEDIRKAYWIHGPRIVAGIARYHAVWSKPCSWVYTSSYERLKADAPKEISAIAGFLGLRVSAEKIASIIRETSFENMAATVKPNSGMEARFRRGVTGDHRNYFDEAIVRDIRRIEGENDKYPRSLKQKIEFAVQCRMKAGTKYVSPA